MTRISNTHQARRRKMRAGVTAIMASALTVAGLAVAPTLAASAETNGIFSDSSRPTIIADSDREAVELGVAFSPQEDGEVTALQYYQGSQAGDVTRATLWTADGDVLARQTFAPSSREGWRTIELDEPVQLEAGTFYAASYFAPDGRYPVTERDLTSSRSQNGFVLPSNAGVFRYGNGDGKPTRSYQGSNYLVDVVYSVSNDQPESTPAPTPTATPRPTTSATPRPSATPTATTAPRPPTTGSGNVVLNRSFPDASNTGVPSGTNLTDYNGTCTISASNVVIDSKVIDCYLRVTGQNLTIRNSVINGAVFSNSGSFTITDSEIRLSATEDTGVGEANFTLTRVEITGGRRSVNCASDCTVQDSYIHAQGKDPSGQAHQSGIRMGSGSVIRHNSIACDAPESPPAGGCSAALTGYGDFATVEKNVIDNNLFLASNAGYCAYGGSSTGKPYSAGVNNVKFTNNIWQHGKSGVCGFWGPIVSFDRSAPGNEWTNNVYDDGKTINP